MHSHLSFVKQKHPFIMLNNNSSTSAAGLVSVVADNVRSLRERRGMSLSELAQRAGIGKSTLSMLEAAKANPSIETLWAIAAALGVPFSHIIEPREPSVVVVRASEGTRVDAEDAAFGARLLTSSRRRGTFEFYTIECEPGAVHDARPHIKGAVEYIYVLDGRLRVGPRDGAVAVGVGELAIFSGNDAHVYEALEPNTRAVMLMNYEEP